MKVKIENLTDPIEVELSSLIVQALSYPIRKVKSNSPSLIRKTGTGRINVLGKVLKTPVVTYDPGDSSLDNTPNEYIDVQEYLNSI